MKRVVNLRIVSEGGGEVTTDRLVVAKLISNGPLSPEMTAHILKLLAQEYQCLEQLQRLLGVIPESQRETAEVLSSDRESEEALCNIRIDVLGSRGNQLGREMGTTPAGGTVCTDPTSPSISSGGEIEDDESD